MIIREHNKFINELFLRFGDGNFEFGINIFGKFFAVEGNYIKGSD